MEEKKIYIFDNRHDWERIKEKKKLKRDILVSHLETQEAVENGQRIIYTFDMLSLNVRLFEYGYRVFLKQKNYQMIEIKFGSKNNWTNRRIDFKQDLLKMYNRGQTTLYLNKL